MAEYKADLEAVFEVCLHAIETQGWTVDDCLVHYASYRSDLEPLLSVVGQLHQARNVSPSPVFHAQALPRLRARLKQSARPGQTSSRAARAPSRPGNSHRPFVQRRFAFASIALVIIMGLAATTTGTIYAAGSALPGDALYPVEQTVEQVQLSFAPPGKAAGLRMDFAEERLDEAEQLRQRGDLGHMQEALDGYNQLVADATQMIDPDNDANDQATLDMLDTRLTHQQTRLQDLLNTAPPAAQKGISTAIEASRHGQEKAAKANKNQGGKKPENSSGSDSGITETPSGDSSSQPTPVVQTSAPPADKGPADCPDGSSLPGNLNGQAHKLANKYKTPYSTVVDLFCTGLTVEQVEAQLSAADEGKSTGKDKGGGKDKP